MDPFVSELRSSAAMKITPSLRWRENPHTSTSSVYLLPPTGGDSGVVSTQERGIEHKHLVAAWKTFSGPCWIFKIRHTCSCTTPWTLDWSTHKLKWHVGAWQECLLLCNILLYLQSFSILGKVRPFCQCDINSQRGSTGRDLRTWHCSPGFQDIRRSRWKYCKQLIEKIMLR